MSKIFPKQYAFLIFNYVFEWKEEKVKFWIKQKKNAIRWLLIFHYQIASMNIHNKMNAKIPMGQIVLLQLIT